jgi:hypothetical protein
VLRSTSPVSLADIEVTREFATSKDGTKIPLNIIRKKKRKIWPILSKYFRRKRNKMLAAIASNLPGSA